MSDLTRLERLATAFGRGAAADKRRLLERLARGRLRTARQVERFHETLCFLRAYPDDAPLLDLVERILAGFDGRGDLRRHRAALADTGIAGTEIRFAFYAATAVWLAERWGDRLTLDWSALESEDALDRLLPLLALYAETPGLDEAPLAVRRWIDRMRGPNETDAAFLARRMAGLGLPGDVHERLWDPLDLPLVLAAGHGTPSRTRAKLPPARIAFQRKPLARERPDLGAACRWRPRSIRAVSRREGRRLVDLAREAMVTRSRDLDVFMHGDPDDVRLIDCGDGLAFAAIGAVPERRLLLEAVYGYLTLKNGVPIGYVLTSALYRSSEIAYNVFETYRGGEAARIYGRVLAVTRHLFGSDTFTVYPYQLGDDNDEALRSGAFWFYQKLGFLPRDPGALRLVRSEVDRMKRKPGHRSSIATLARLAAHNVYYSLGRPREDVIGVLSLANVGLAVTDSLARRFGSDRATGERVAAREAAALLGVRSLDRFGPGERLWWRRWAPLVLALPGVSRWPAADRRALAAVVRAKGGRRESEFVRLFDAHRRLRRAIVALAGSG